LYQIHSNQGLLRTKKLNLVLQYGNIHMKKLNWFNKTWEVKNIDKAITRLS